jgi:hypothetical protein
MLQEVVPELQAENEKLWQLIQRLLRHRYGPRSEKLGLEQLQLVLEDPPSLHGWHTLHICNAGGIWC